MKVPIKNAKIRKIGNSFCIAIPMAYINNGLVNLEKCHDVEITEIKGKDALNGITPHNYFFEGLWDSPPQNEGLWDYAPQCTT